MMPLAGSLTVVYSSENRCKQASIVSTRHPNLHSRGVFHCPAGFAWLHLQHSSVLWFRCVYQNGSTRRDHVHHSQHGHPLPASRPGTYGRPYQSERGWSDGKAVTLACGWACTPLLSGLILIGARAKLYSSEVGLALSAVLSILVFAAIIWINASSLGKVDSWRQRAEAQRQSEERFRSLTTATSQIVWTTSIDGRVSEDSPSWRAFTGQTFEEYKEFGWLYQIKKFRRQIEHLG